MEFDRQKLIYGTLGVIGVFLFLTIAYYATGNNAPGTAETEPDYFPQLEEIAERDHTQWASDSAVVLIEYSDLQCPACAQYEKVVEQFEADYPETAQQATFVYRHFPLVFSHPNALPAAYATEAAAAQGEFYAMIDYLFENQSDWQGLGDPKERFIEYAQDLELDVEQFTADYDSEAVRAKVQTDQQSGQDIGISETPSFFLNGQRVRFATALDLKNMIEQEIAAVQAADAVATDSAESESGGEDGAGEESTDTPADDNPDTVPVQ